MDGQVEKVYVAVGNDLQDGIGALEWALKKWSSHSISIVILHATINFSNDFVYTPFGKLPASSVSDEKLEVLRKYEQEKIDNLLSKYKTFCGEVKAEILKVEKYDEPIHKLIIDLISGLRITKLVVGITFMKSSSGKSKNAISGSFYVHRYKPEFCELFIICGGKMVFLREQKEEGFMEDDNGIMVAKLKEKASFKGWLGKMFTDNPNNNLIHGRNHPCSPSTSTGSPDSRNLWENYVQEIEDYFQQLLSLNLDEKDWEENDVAQISPTEPNIPEFIDSNKIVTEKIETLRIKIDEVRETIQLKRKEAKDNVERNARAEWAICLCNRRTEELEARINEEMMNRIDIQKDLGPTKENVFEVVNDIKESKSRLNSILQLQSELSNKLHSSSVAKSHAETQVEKAVIARAEMVCEIEELRRQRDVLHRRIEFCKEKDAIGMVNQLSCSYKEYTADEIRSATDDFSDSLRLKSGGNWTNVYKARINHATVAVKMLSSVNGLSQEGFQAKVKFLCQIRHPNLVAMIGFCSELNCTVFEYMHSGSLRDILFSSHRTSRRRNRALRWPDRIRVASEVCTGMSFLHLAEPRPIIHGNLNPSNILLDRNLVAKIHGFGLTRCSDEYDVRSDVRAFGFIMLQLLTGRDWAGHVEVAMVMNTAALIEVLDKTAGEWPLDLAEEFVEIAMRCLSVDQGPNTDLRITTVMRELDEVKKKAADLVAMGGCEVVIEGDVNTDDSSDVPSVFLCPIFQEVMKNPHVAADGFSYELEAIEEWLGMGRDTSPMTNLRLKHKLLTPNQTLRSLIEDWHNRRPAPSP